MLSSYFYIPNLDAYSTNLEFITSQSFLLNTALLAFLGIVFLMRTIMERQSPYLKVCLGFAVFAFIYAAVYFYMNNLFGQSLSAQGNGVTMTLRGFIWIFLAPLLTLVISMLDMSNLHTKSHFLFVIALGMITFISIGGGNSAQTQMLQLLFSSAAILSSGVLFVGSLIFSKKIAEVFSGRFVTSFTLIAKIVTFSWFLYSGLSLTYAIVGDALPVHLVLNIVDFLLIFSAAICLRVCMSIKSSVNSVPSAKVIQKPQISPKKVSSNEATDDDDSKSVRSLFD